MLKVSTLSYNKEVDRYCIGTLDLHCGQCFEIDNNGQWESVRIEMRGERLVFERNKQKH